MRVKGRGLQYVPDLPTYDVDLTHRFFGGHFYKLQCRKIIISNIYWENFTSVKKSVYEFVSSCL